MPGDTLRVAVDIRDLLSDLRAMESELIGVLTDQLDQAATLVAEATRPLTPYHEGNEADDLPHLRDSIEAQGVKGSQGVSSAVVSTVPQGPVFEWGGDIAPKVPGGATVARAIKPSAVIHIARTQMAHRAFDLMEPRIEVELQQAVDRVVAAFNA